jgi:hypothetical protein
MANSARQRSITSSFDESVPYPLDRVAVQPHRRVHSIPPRLERSLIKNKPTLGLSAQALILTCLRPSPKHYDDDCQGCPFGEAKPAAAGSTTGKDLLSGITASKIVCPNADTLIRRYTDTPFSPIRRRLRRRVPGKFLESPNPAAPSLAILGAD